MLNTGVRDYIPDTSEMSKKERAHLEAQRARLAPDGVIRDFVPGKGHKLLPGQTREEAAEDAFRKAQERERTALRDEYERALAKVQTMNPSETVQFIRTLPTALQELHLLAEERGPNRTAVLEHFPPIDPSVRERFQ